MCDHFEMDYIDTYIAECPACRSYIQFEEIVTANAEAKPYLQIRHDCPGSENMSFSAMCIGRKAAITSALVAPAG